MELLPSLDELVTEVASATGADLRVVQTAAGLLSTDPPPAKDKGAGEGDEEDWESEVRTSAVHAAKRLSRLQPPLFRANGGAVVTSLIKNLAPLTLDKRNTHVQTAAQRSMMHCLSAAGWTNPEGLPRQQLGGECTNTCADFLRRSYKRMLAMESDAEGSDEDPI